MNHNCNRFGPNQFWCNQIWIASVLVMFASLAPANASDTLRSPWDAHPVTATDEPYTCPTTPPLPQDFATNHSFFEQKTGTAQVMPKKSALAKSAGPNPTHAASPTQNSPT